MLASYMYIRFTLTIANNKAIAKILVKYILFLSMLYRCFCFFLEFTI